MSALCSREIKRLDIFGATDAAPALPFGQAQKRELDSQTIIDEIAGLLERVGPFPRSRLHGDIVDVVHQVPHEMPGQHDDIRHLPYRNARSRKQTPQDRSVCNTQRLAGRPPSPTWNRMGKRYKRLTFKF